MIILHYQSISALYNLASCKYSCMFFCATVSGYSQIICYLQEKLTHFDLRVMTNFGLEVSGYFILRKLNTQIKKIFEIYPVFMNNLLCRAIYIYLKDQVFMHNFLCQNDYNLLSGIVDIQKDFDVIFFR